MRNSSSSSAFVTLIPTVPSALQLATMKLSETMQPSQILGTKHKLAVCILVPLSIGIVANNYSLRVNAQIVRRETGRRDQKPTWRNRYLVNTSILNFCSLHPLRWRYGLSLREASTWYVPCRLKWKFSWQLNQPEPPAWFPEYTKPGSTEYVYRDASFWTSGFFPGLLYLIMERRKKIPKLNCPFLAFLDQSQTFITYFSLSTAILPICNQHTLLIGHR